MAGKHTGLEGYYSIKNNKKMRFGYTTGSCAAGAAKAAGRMLLLDESCRYTELMTPKGISLNLEILHMTRGENWVSCAVQKDAGDDPDRTDGLEIYAKVEKRNAPGICIDGGEGVGRITKRDWSSLWGARRLIKYPEP